MGYSSSKGKVPAGLADKSSVLKLLPQTAKPLTTSLPSEDQEVLAHLVVVAPGNHLAGAISVDVPAGKSVWKPWKNANTASSASLKAGGKGNALGSREAVSTSSPGGRQQHSGLAASSPTSYFTNMRSKNERSGRKVSPVATHKPTFGCDCFDCYSYFWSRWNDSPNRHVIDDILDLFDGHLVGEQSRPTKSCSEDSTECEMKQAEGQVESIGKKRLQEEDQSGKKATEPGSRRGKLSWKKRGKEERAKTGKGKPKAVVEEVGNESSSLDTEVKDVNEGNGGKEAEQASPIVNSLCSGGPNEIPLNQGIVFGAANEENPTANVSQDKKSSGEGKQRGGKSKNESTGKRKSKQVTPLDCEGSQAVLKEEEAAVTGETANTITLRAEDTNLRGRGFFSRVFPDALGGVATRLWDLVSLRMRSRTMDFY